MVHVGENNTQEFTVLTSNILCTDFSWLSCVTFYIYIPKTGEELLSLKDITMKASCHLLVHVYTVVNNHPHNPFMLGN